MPDINLASRIKEQLPAELVSFLRLAGGSAAKKSQKVYLVGGVVRDILLGRPNLDIDLVIEGTALELVKALAPDTRITFHSAFLTITFRWSKWRIDIATARSEFYTRPGALPIIKTATIMEDLIRRDFTVNAMAICLNPDCFGKLIDLFHGAQDVRGKIIRILHDQSFTDDATRMWRAIRYEQRLGFTIEPHSMELLIREIPMLATVTGDRIRHELGLVMEEPFPEKILKRAEELGMLQRLHPQLSADEWLASKFALIREPSTPHAIRTVLYWALLTYRLSGEQVNDLLGYLKLPKSISKIIEDTELVEKKLPALDRTGLTPSEIYCLLHGYSPIALIANSIASKAALIKDNMSFFLGKLRHLTPRVTGEDLINMGVAPGYQIRDILHQLHKVILDQNIDDREAELDLVRSWLSNKRGTGLA